MAGRWRHGSLHVNSLGLALRGEAAKGQRLREQSEARSLQNEGFKMWNAARSRRGSWGAASEPDVRAAVAPRVAELMGQGWAKGLLSKIHQEVGVQLQPSPDCVYVDLQHHRAFPGGNRAGEERGHRGPPLLPSKLGKCWGREEGFLRREQSLQAELRSHQEAQPLWERRAGRGAQVVSLPDEIRVKLPVPGTVQRCGDIETCPIQAELDHLRASSHSLPLGKTKGQTPGLHTDRGNQWHPSNPERYSAAAQPSPPYLSSRDLRGP